MFPGATGGTYPALLTVIGLFVLCGPPQVVLWSGEHPLSLPFIQSIPLELLRTSPQIEILPPSGTRPVLFWRLPHTLLVGF